MKNLILYSAIILLGLLAIIGWQWANSLSYQIAVRDATIDNLTSQVKDTSQSLAKQESVLDTLLIRLEASQKRAERYQQWWFKERNRPHAEATQTELAGAYKIIAEGISNHLYYVRNPEKQTPETGDTELNWLWVNNYQLIQSLIDRAYGVKE